MRDWRCTQTAILLVTVTFLQFQTVESTYQLRVRAHHYQNSNSRLSDGSSCDGFFGGQCENRFKFCMRGHGASRDNNQNNCPLGYFTTGEVGDDFFSFGTYQIYDMVPNPMVFDGTIWEGGFQLLVVVYDEDPLNSDDHVDNVYAEEYLSPGGSISQRDYVGESENSRIRLSFSLSCNTNYNGSDCNTYCEARNDYQGHYSCHSTTGAKLCLAGWSNLSTNCLTPVCDNNCNSSTGGYCLIPGQCLCRSGWTGSGCNQCQPSSGCSMIGGLCNVPGECICRENYFGAHCEVDLIPCDRNGGGPCSQGMLCTNDGQGGYMCHCPAGLQECETECDPNPCLYQSTCAVIQNGFKCVCPSGSREECDREHNYCNPYPCENGGTCLDQLGGYECECTVGWTGDRCQSNIDDCVSAPCQNGGTCFIISPSQDLIGSYRCSCTSGFYGSNCELLNECLSGPCLNGGVCQELVHSYSCNCSDGFDGSNCEQNLLPCRDNPCQNGGTCIGVSGSYSCVCPPGYTDYHCLVPVEVPQVKDDNSSQTDVKVHISRAIPVLVVVLLIVVITIGAIAFYCHHKKKRQPMLCPPPGRLMENEMVAVGPVAKGKQNLQMSSKDQACPVYETLDTYGAPTNEP